MKNLKPIEVDAQFKYRCTDPECGSEQWLFLNQVKVKGFKLVCDCGAVYSIRPVADIKIKYPKKIGRAKTPATTQPDNVNTTQELEYIAKACKVLEHYGFASKEAKDLIHKVHDITECTDSMLLVKDALKLFGGMYTHG